MRHFTLAEIADRLGGWVADGEPTLPIFGVKPPEEAGAGDITLATTRAHVVALERTGAAAALAPAGLVIRRPTVRVREPRLAFARLLELFYCADTRAVSGVDPRAFVAPGARLGREVNIAAGAYVGDGAEIGDRVDLYPAVYVGDGARVGDDSILFANVAVYPGTVIGKRARIHSGAVLGSDGFGYAPGPSGEYYKVPQVGRVELGDDVEIGANTTVDRATLTATRIGSGTKIDNLVQIGHNVSVGNHVCIIAQSGVAGSVRIGDRAVLAAAAGLIDHITIGEGAQVAARAGVTKDVPAGTSVAGTPAIALSDALRAYSLIGQLPEYRRRLKELEERCARLEAELQARRKQD
ncbi:MAG: UDP-3-O-(3-hydroxymyristoyl)glucosamine N-acyltransferase [Deltaproteobacteria bacterium]|nr:UDP-3-O-(3-hydroxymyristoyl)glucosamine N-acyltransferase [Deltaproteobacteria bacterium]